MKQKHVDNEQYVQCSRLSLIILFYKELLAIISFLSKI